MALLFGLWTVGWAFGPTFYGGEDNSLIPEHFRFLPVSWRKLARGMLGASTVGVGAAVTLVAFSALCVYAIPLGVGPA